MKNFSKILFLFGITFSSMSMADAIDSSDAAHPNPVPQIPTTDFTWNGIFQANGATLSDPPTKAPLTIRGKKEGHYFNVYMQQGAKKDPRIWVENLIYKDALYTITHRWHREVPDGILGVCFKSPNISVKDLNGILKSSRLVGPEVVDQQPVNHFRSSCLSSTFFGLIRVNTYSDIYVPRDRPYPWIKWLQFGDGVSLDLHNDEWFIFNHHDDHADSIKLPQACKHAVEVIQDPSRIWFINKKMRRWNRLTARSR